MRNQRERQRQGRKGDEKGRDVSPSLTTPDRHKSSRDPELEVKRRTPTPSRLPGGGRRLELDTAFPPPPSWSKKKSTVHAARKAASGGRGAGRGADKSAAGAVSGGEGGKRGGRSRRREGDQKKGASDRARRRGVRCVLALEQTRGPSLTFSILRAISPPSPSGTLFRWVPLARGGGGTGSGNSTTGSWVHLPHPSPLIAGLY